jgi:hypothetical protein
MGQRLARGDRRRRVFSGCAFEFTNYDDPDYVTDNPHIALSIANVAWAFTSGYAGNWFPLSCFSTCWISRSLV